MPVVVGLRYAIEANNEERWGRCGPNFEQGQKNNTDIVKVFVNA